MKLIYGTTNKAKIDLMKRRIEPLGIEILSLDDVGVPKLDIDENGSTPLGNAKIKARAYYQELKMPLFSCDSGLFIEGFDVDRQPGVNVRGADNSMSDDETIAYYSALAAESGGNMTARYLNAIYLILDERRIYEYAGEDIASEPFLITATPHKKRKKGFPIDCLSVNIENGKYYYDIDGNGEKYTSPDDGFRAFFQRVLEETLTRTAIEESEKLLK